MKPKISLIVIAVLMLACLEGCGKQNGDDQGSNHSYTSDANQTYDSDANQTDERQNSDNGNLTNRQSESPSYEEIQDNSPADGEQLLAGCTLTGTVTEFSGDGCKITPTIQEGNVAYEAAPGCEDESKLIHIIYDEECSFQISYINRLNGTVTYSTASIEDVKKQTSLIIYGTYDSENNLAADHIYIYRSTEG